MSLPVLYDACVLYPAPLRDFLIRIGRTGLVKVRWTDRILNECFTSVIKDRPDLSPEDLARTRHLMNVEIPDVLVTGYEESMAGLALPDPGDQHVLAAAITAKVKIIVTFNLRDFPTSAPADILDMLNRNGLPETATRLRQVLGV